MKGIENQKDIKYMKSFQTIDECINHLKSLGCQWNDEKQRTFDNLHNYIFEDSWIFFDDVGILDE